MQAPQENGSRHPGLIMLGLAWLVGLGLAAFLFQDWLDQRQNPNTQPQGQYLNGRAQVVLQPNHQHHYLTSAQINGQPVTLLVDTGASDVVIPAALAKGLNLPKLGSGYAVTANGRTRITLTRLDSLTIGPIRLKDVPASIAEGYQANEILFGMSALRQLDFRSEGGKLILEQ